MSALEKSLAALSLAILLVTPVHAFQGGDEEENCVDLIGYGGPSSPLAPALRTSTPRLAALGPNGPGGGLAAGICAVDNARDNGPSPYKTNADFVPVVGDDSQGFYCVYGVHASSTGGIAGNVSIYLFDLDGGEVLLYGSGYGNIPGANLFDAAYDMGRVDQVLRFCMGKVPANTPIRILAPHGHADHINPACNRELERLGYRIVEMAFHPGDFPLINGMAWTAADRNLFRILPTATTCLQELATYSSPLGKMWVFERPGHTPGSIDLVLDVRNDPNNRFVIRGSQPSSPCAPLPGQREIINAHGNIELFSVPPAVVDVNPPAGTAMGGTLLAVTGVNFAASGAGTPVVMLDGAPASNVVVASDTALTCLTPAGPPGQLVDVAVVNNNGESVSTSTFFYNALPTLTLLTPNNGNWRGGTIVQVRGSGFQLAAGGLNDVSFGTRKATSVVVKSDTLLTCRAPLGAPGTTVPVSIVNPNGEATLDNAFRYNSDLVITGATPPSATALGGTDVVLTGTSFTGNGATPTVTVGGLLATNVVLISDTSLSFVAPAGASGTTVDIVLTNSAGSAVFPGFRYRATPGLTALAPSSGRGAGGTLVTLTGTGFLVDAAGANLVRFGGALASQVTVQTDTRLTCIAPGGLIGSIVNVTVANANGTASLPAAFTYMQPLELLSLGPTSGSSAGGTTVTLTGSGFVDGPAGQSTVRFGGVAATQVSTEDDTILTCIAPGGTPQSTVDVSITNANGTFTLPAAFHFNARPVLTSLAPNNGHAGTSTPVTLTGSGFLNDNAGSTLVVVGGVTATNVVAQSDTQLTCLFPSGIPGATVDVILVNQNGSTSLVQGFRYHTAPSLTSLTPVNGPATSQPRITLNGSGFLNDSAGLPTITFGGLLATAVSVQSDTRVLCNAPAGTPGRTVDVIVANARGTGSLGNGYRYNARPGLTSATPNRGTFQGGTQVVLAGSGFVIDSPGPNTVTFGGVAATNVVVLSDTSLRCNTPPGTVNASVDVVVVNANGSSTLTKGFSYSVPAPGVVAITPSHGPANTPGSAQITGSGFLADAAGPNTVRFGVASAAAVVVVDDATLTCQVPPGAPGTSVDVVVANTNGSGQLVRGYRYHAVPSLTALTPPSASALGGATLQLTGAGFLNDAPGTNAVTIGGLPALNVAVVNDTTLTCTLPAGPAGSTVNVVVSNANGSTAPRGLRFHAAPSLSAITPLFGPAAGGTHVTLSGAGFLLDSAGPAAVSFGGRLAANVLVLGDGTLACDTPRGTTGFVDVLITNANGTATLPGGYHFGRLPSTLTALEPGNGPALGRNVITLHGQGLLDGSVGTNRIKFGDVFATNVITLDDSTILCTAPPGTAGTIVDVALNNNTGTSTLPLAYRFNARPTLTAVNPPEGPSLLATKVTLTGSGFLKDAAGVPTVIFGMVRVRDALVIDDTHITCTAVGGAPGTTLDVTVKNANGQVMLPQAFLVTGGPPVITSIKPNGGPYVGGTRVDIDGNGFAAGSLRVSFGGVPALNLALSSDTHLSCTTPPGTLGQSVTVSLSTKNGTVAAIGGYTYGPILPALASVRPDHGPAAGGTRVTLAGKGFKTDGAGTTRVTFDGLAATNVVVLDDLTVTCDTPSGPAGGRVAVVLANDFGSTTLQRGFRYNEEPALTALTPTTGRADGGTRVTLTGAGFRVNEPGTNTVRFGGVVALDVVATSDQVLSCTAPPGVGGATVDVTLDNKNGVATLPGAFRYFSRPVIDGVTPNRGPRAGGTTLTIAGHGFTADGAGTNQVKIGGVAAPNVVTLDDLTILCTTPARASSGLVDVQVTNGNGSDTEVGGFAYFVPPSLTSIAPARGPVAGGTAVTITGVGFQDAAPGTTLVLFGGVSALDVFEVSDTTLTCTTPPGTPGSAVDVTLVNENGLAVLVNGFRYTGAPVLTALAPNHGPTSGAPVTLTGSGFVNDGAGANTITLGGLAATQIVAVDDATLTCRAPAGTGGALVDVRVTNANGTSSLAAAYRYNREPTLTNVLPSRGPAAGGTSVTLTGTGFQVDEPGKAMVLFGGLAASDVVVVSDTTITCTSPSAVANTLVNVTVANANGSAVRTAAFRYNALPVLAGVAPASGPATGGNLVTLNGSGFGVNSPGTNTVFFGAAPATSVTVVNDASLTCLAPAGTGGATVDVSLNNANGSATLVAAYRYRPAPTLASLAPGDGPASGGTVVTLTGTGFADPNAGTTAVTFAGVVATALTVLDDAHVRCTAPAGTAGSSVAVALINANGTATLAAAFRYHARPALTAVVPARGSSAASSNLTLVGTGFLADAAGPNAVTFGVIAATNVVVVNDTSLTCTVAPQAAGSIVDVRVTNLNGNALLAGAFAFDAPAPKLLALAPTSGLANGGTSVTLTGTGFQAFSAGTNTITFGGAAASSVVVVSDTTLTCLTPSGTAGASVTVAVSNVNGASQLAAAYTYLAPGPTLTAVAPANGPSTGGGTLTLTGSGFQANAAGTNAVTFGGVAATNVNALGDTSLTCTVPPGTGTVTVALANANGTAQLAAGYRYNALPTLTTIAPVDGTSLGGTLVTVRGTGFLNDSPGTNQVLFGGAPASSVVVFDDTRLTCRAPSGSPGAIVTLSLANLNGAAQLTNAFRYHARPALTDVVPANGPRVGGTRVTLNGTGFLADGAVVNIVSFGGVTATSVSVINDKTIQCNVPAGTAGTAVQVTVANVNGTALLPSGYRYNAIPTLTALAPPTGPATGGTLVTLTGSGFQVDSPGPNAVTFGGVAATSVSVLSNTSLTCLAPAGTNGATVDVALANANGAATLFGAFTYSSAVPVLAGLLPTKGTTQGSTNVTLQGSAFVPGMAVTFGGTAASDVNVLDANTITCTTPPVALEGWVDVVVDIAGLSASLPLGFQYVDPPTLAALEPATGLPAGGEMVVLTGSGFLDGAGPLGVTFNGVPALDITALDDTHAVCTTPDGPLLTDADVVLTNDIGATTLARGFRWQLRLPTDLDQDGRGDLVIGTPGDDVAALNAGAVHVFLGTPMPLATRTSATPDLMAKPERSATSFGTPVISGDLDGDGRPELVIGAPADDRVIRDGGAIYVYDGPLGATTTPLTPATASQVITSIKLSDRLGRSLALHDLDRNGFLDLIAGAPGRTPGTVYVYLGGPGGIPTLPSFTINGKAGNEGFASTVDAGDLDGDGWPELVVGAQNAFGDLATSPTGTTWHPGEVRIYHGGLANLTNDPQPWRVIAGREDGAQFGATVATVDLTGDGLADLAVGSPASSRNGGGSGAVFLFEGRVDLASMDTSGASAVFDAETLGDRLGSALASADVDHDGRADLLVGAPGYAGIGRAYLLLGANPLLSRSVGGADAVLLAETGTAGEFGATLAFVDVDGNGHDDVVVTAPGFSGEIGRVYVFDGVTILGGRDAAASDGVLSGKNGGDRLGQAVNSDY